MTLDLTKPIRTKDGRQAKYLYTVNNPSNDYPVQVIVTTEGVEAIQCYSFDGVFYRGAPDVLDLENVPEPKYKLIYSDGYIVPQAKWLASKVQFEVENYEQDKRIGYLVQTGDEIVFEKL